MRLLVVACLLLAACTAENPEYNLQLAQCVDFHRTDWRTACAPIIDPPVVDLSVPPDMAIPPDLTPPPDLTIGPDLIHVDGACFPDYHKCETGSDCCTGACVCDDEAHRVNGRCVGTATCLHPG